MRRITHPDGWWFLPVREVAGTLLPFVPLIIALLLAWLVPFVLSIARD